MIRLKNAYYKVPEDKHLLDSAWAFCRAASTFEKLRQSSIVFATFICQVVKDATDHKVHVCSLVSWWRQRHEGTTYSLLVASSK